MPEQDATVRELNQLVDLAKEVKGKIPESESNSINNDINNLIELANKEAQDGINNDPDEGVEEITAEQIREMKINKLKESKLGPKPKKNYGVAYKAERKRKNKEKNKSRKANRR